MKYIFTLVYLFFGLTLVFGQERILPNFKESKTVWLNKIINKNFPFDPSSSKDSFGSHSFIDMLEVDDCIYTLFWTSDPEANRPPNGYILNKTNKQTGDVIWSDVNTPFNGSPGSLFAYNISLRSDDKIEIVANRKVDFNDGSSYRYYPLSYRRVYNQNTGEIVGTYYDKEDKASLGKKGTFKYAHYHCVEEDSIYLAYYNDIVVNNGSAFQNLRFGLLNGAMDIAEDTVVSIFDPDVRLGFGFHQIFSNFSMRLNDSTVIWLSTHLAHDQTNNKNKVRLFFIDVKEPSNIYVRKKVVLDDKLFIQKIPQTTTYLYVRNNEIFIMNYNLLLNPQKIEFNILHLDDNGNEIGFYKELNRDGIPYINILPIKTTDSLSYFVATKPNQNQNDLFTINRSAQYKLLTTITTKEDKPEHYFQILENSCLLTEENTLIYGGAYNERNPTRNTVLMHGFDLNALITGYTNVEDLPREDHQLLKIYPNPTYNYITISGLDSPATVYLCDVNGSSIKQVEKVSSQMDLSDIPHGIYFLRIVTNDKTEIHKIIVVKE